MNRQYRQFVGCALHTIINKRCAMHTLPLILFFFVFASNLGAASVNLLFDDKMPQAVFAAGDIQTALKARGHNVKQLRLTQFSQVTDGVRIVLSFSSNEDINHAV